MKSKLTLVTLATLSGTPTVKAQVDWHHDGLGTRREHAIAAAPTTSPATVVLFGGRDDGGELFGDTWTWRASAWQEEHPARSPAPRAGHSMVFDPRRNVTVLHGGHGRNDTWEWDGSQWRQAVTANTPPALTGPAMAYDPVGRAVLLFGAALGAPSVAELWRYDSNDWTRLTLPGPSPRVGARMATDSQRQRVVLFGGTDLGSGAILAETWEWNGSSWQRHSPANAPAPRTGHVLADANGSVILIGGGGSPLETRETWWWDGSTWTRGADGPGLVDTAAVGEGPNGVLVHGGASMAFTPAGTSLGDTWHTSPAGWLQVHAFATPDGLGRHAMAYDPHRDVLLVCGGQDQSSIPYFPTWEWDGAAWARVGGSPPPFRIDAAMAYDAARRRMVLFGGRGFSAPMGDTWLWDGIAWIAVASSPPPAREGAAMVWDAARKQIVMFGGVGLADTWLWDGTSWNAATPPVSPPSGAHPMLFDTWAGVGVLFTKTDWWIWNGGSWSRVPGRGLPPISASTTPSELHAVHDIERDRYLIWDESDLWEFDGSSWVQRVVSASPRATSQARIAYDSKRARTIKFGGRGNNAFSNSLWSYGPVARAAHVKIGTGCAGSGGTPNLTPSGLPWLGDRPRLLLSNMPAGPNLIGFGMSASQWAGQPLPRSLASIGRPACQVWSSWDVVFPIVAPGGATAIPVPIPNRPSLLGQTFFSQAAGVDSAGVVVSASVGSTVGGK